MERVEITPEKLIPANARDLLRRYLYGNPADLDLLMRFAEEHGLSRDNMVWLMTSILKVNANLVRDLLSCMAGVQEARDKDVGYQHEVRAELVRLVERLQAQIEAVTARAAGKLDTAVSRFERVARDLTKFSNALVIAATDFKATRSTFRELVEAEDTESALKAFVRVATEASKREIRSYVQNMLRDLDIRFRVPRWLLWTLGAQQVITIVLVTSLVVRHA